MSTTNVFSEVASAVNGAGFTCADISFLQLAMTDGYGCAIPGGVLEYRSGDCMKSLGEGLHGLGSYDSGFGGQFLFGTIVFKDGSYLSRGEHDGSEWFEYNRTPVFDSSFAEQFV